MESIGCFFWYPAFWLVLFHGLWLANRPEMTILIGQISWLLIGWTRSIQKATLHFIQACDWLYRGCINLSFFFFIYILGFFFLIFIDFFLQLNTTSITFTAIHDCLHSGASTDMIMSSWGLERYQAALDLHLSTSGDPMGWGVSFVIHPIIMTNVQV
jgi:hypothetical protein